jgi:hypothetical protein
LEETMKKLTVTICSLVLLVGAGAWAEPAEIYEWYDTRQDPLQLPEDMHELGLNPPFPRIEEIDAWDTITDQTACFEAGNEDNPNIPNALVSIVNKTGQKWWDLHYVANPDTSLTNDDGVVNQGLAFRIDYQTLNRPLVWESINADLVFEPNEQWDFIIQDYQSAVGPPSMLGSIGVGSLSGAGTTQSTGSIIAIPEPATIAVLGIGGMVLFSRRQRRQ